MRKLNILFVSSGNNVYGVSPIILNQGKSLLSHNINIEYFTIKGKNIIGYLRSVRKIKVKTKSKKYNLIHAHYSYSAFAATLAFPGVPIVASLMGSDSKMNIFWKYLIRLFSIYLWKVVIVKSKEMKQSLRLKDAYIIPNGVLLSKFTYREKEEIRLKMGLDVNKKYILFLSDPSRKEKNFPLAKQSLEIINDKDLILLPIYGIPHNEVANYLYASDVLLLTSLWEGSPNVIKEAMVTNIPIVSTDVGDVKWLLDGVEGCYITSYKPDDVAKKIMLALGTRNTKTQIRGRERIIELGLDSESVAKRIIAIYDYVSCTE